MSGLTVEVVDYVSNFQGFVLSISTSVERREGNPPAYGDGEAGVTAVDDFGREAGHFQVEGDAQHFAKFCKIIKKV